MVSGEAIIINKEETGSLKEKRDYKRGSVHAHTKLLTIIEDFSTKKIRWLNVIVW